MKKKYIAIFITCATAQQARRIADSLLSKRLVACANIMPWIESKFWWNGKINKARETQLIVKTVAANFVKVEKEVKRLHSYEVPEVIALQIAAGSRDYLEWLEESVKP